MIECFQRSFCVLAVYWTQSRAALVLECTQITRLPSTEGAGGFEGAPDHCRGRRGPPQTLGLPGQAGALLRVVTLEEHYFDGGVYYAALVK